MLDILAKCLNRSSWFECERFHTEVSYGWRLNPTVERSSRNGVLEFQNFLPHPLANRNISALITPTQIIKTVIQREQWQLCVRMATNEQTSQTDGQHANTMPPSPPTARSHRVRVNPNTQTQCLQAHLLHAHTELGLTLTRKHNASQPIYCTLTQLGLTLTCKHNGSQPIYCTLTQS